MTGSPWRGSKWRLSPRTGECSASSARSSPATATVRRLTVTGFPGPCPASASSVQKGESLKDTVATLSAYDPAAIVIRHPHIGAPELVAHVTGAHIVNAGDGNDWMEGGDGNDTVSGDAAWGTAGLPAFALVRRREWAKVLPDAADLAEDEWDRVLRINLKGAFLCAQAAARRFQGVRFFAAPKPDAQPGAEPLGLGAPVVGDGFGADDQAGQNPG